MQESRHCPRRPAFPSPVQGGGLLLRRVCRIVTMHLDGRTAARVAAARRRGRRGTQQEGDAIVGQATEGSGISVGLLAACGAALPLVLVLLVVLFAGDCDMEPGHPAPREMYVALVGAPGATELQGFGATWQGYRAWLRFKASGECIDSVIGQGYEPVEWSSIDYRFGLPADGHDAFDPPWDPGAIAEKECYTARVTEGWTHSGEHCIVIDRSSGTVHFFGVGS